MNNLTSAMHCRREKQFFAQYNNFKPSRGREGQSENSGIHLFTCASGLRLKRLLWFGQYALRTQEPTQISEAKTTAAY
ncbi:hypothetical protein T01_6474 [Trichinella spiralis]|uniref:Uncharacterized protein n=1 Tax=Trichinella spiralis TaxID=6334 RepID=A0A0V1AXZ2_TRISP|nr:hypothetical protein T01_6474 [Trichinella spiralis]